MSTEHKGERYGGGKGVLASRQQGCGGVAGVQEGTCACARDAGLRMPRGGGLRAATPRMRPKEPGERSGG